MRNLQQKSTRIVAQGANDRVARNGYRFGMAEITTIHAGKQPNRPHFIPDWAERRGLSQAELGRELGADKSVVSRWFKGSTPSLDWQLRLAALFGVERESLFRHPDDDWLARFFRGRSLEEIEKMKQMLELAFPKRTGTGG